MTALLVVGFVLAVFTLRAVVIELARRRAHRIAPYVAVSELWGRIEVYGRTPEEAEKRCQAVITRRLEERAAKGWGE